MQMETSPPLASPRPLREILSFSLLGAVLGLLLAGWSSTEPRFTTPSGGVVRSVIQAGGSGHPAP